MLFNSMLNPFKSVTTREALSSNKQRLEQLNKALSTQKNSLSKDQMESMQEEIGQLLSANKSLIEEDVNRVGMLSDNEKTALVKIDNKNRKLAKQYQDTKSNNKLSESDKQTKLDTIIAKYEANDKTKDDIINKYTPKDVAKHVAAQDLLIKKTNAQMKSMGGALDITVRDVSDAEMKLMEIGEIQGDDIRKSMESEISSIDTAIEKAQNVVSNPESTKAEVKQAKLDIKNNKALKTETVNKVEAIVGPGRTYGSMTPVTKIVGGKKVLQGFDIVINKKVAIKNGKFSTKAHEFVHAVLHNTIKGDPGIRAAFGGKIQDLLDSNKLKFKTEADKKEYERRVAIYGEDMKGEEMLVIASEMLSDNKLEFNDTLLQQFKDIIRNFTQQYMGTDIFPSAGVDTGIALNDLSDVRDFLKDMHKSIRTGKPNKSITKMMMDGAGGSILNEVPKPPKDYKEQAMFSKAVDLNMKANPDLMDTFDQFTKNEDGSPKHESQEDFEASPDYYNAYLEIVEGSALDGLIRQGMTAQGLPPEALKEFTTKVKEGIGRRFLPSINKKTGETKPGYKVSNDSLFGWLTGVAGGAGKSIIYRAKGDVMNEYKKDKIADTVSLDNKVGDGTSFGDMMVGERSSTLADLDDMDLTPGRKEAAEEVINELKAREVLEFSEGTNEAISKAIKEANVPLDNLIYKDIKAFLNTAEKVTKKDKNGDLVIDKKTGEPKLFKATKTGDVKPSGPLFKVLDAVSKEFGIDALRILADQDLNGAQRKAAQRYIYNKSVNANGSFNNNIFQLLAEGETKSGIATGAANTKLGQLYVEGDRAEFKKGATAAGKITQTKMRKVDMDTWLNLFGISPDGTLDPKVKSDGAIRALVVQMAQLEANQQMRIQAYDSGSTSDAVLAKLGEGKGEMVFSKDIDTDQIAEFHEAVSLGDQSKLSIALSANKVFGTAEPGKDTRARNKLIDNTLNQLEGFRETNEALQGELKSISGKELVDMFKEQRTKDLQNQGIKNLLKTILPKDANGKAINPGSLANTKDGLNTQRTHISLTVAALIEDAGPDLTYKDRSEVRDEDWKGSGFRVAEDGDLEGMTFWEVKLKDKKESRFKTAVAEAARLMIAHGVSSFAGSGKAGDGRYTSKTPGGDMVETPGWEGPDGLKWKRNDDGSFKLNKKGNKIAKENRQQPTTGIKDFLGLVNKGLPKGFSILNDKKGEFILVDPSGGRTKLDTKLADESSKSLFADISRNGLHATFNTRKEQSLEARKVAKVTLDLAWNRVKTDDSIDSFNAGDFGLLVMSLGSSMNGPLRKAAYADKIPANYEALVAKYGKDAIGQIFQYEHGTPKVVIASRIINSYMEKGEMTDDVWDGYTVQVIHKALDRLIDASGHKFTSRIDGQPRAFNEDTLALSHLLTSEELSEIAPLVSMEQYNHDIMGVNWVAVAKQLKDNLTISQTQLQNISKGRTTGMWSKDTEIKGASIWDFDDTLARTKSGVRYKLPNPSGTPQPGRKVIFMAGGAGSGKSGVIKSLGLESQGYKLVNQDISLEWLKKNAGLPTDMNDLTDAQLSEVNKLSGEARRIAKRKQGKFKGRGDGVVVDGTGGSLNVIKKKVQEFKDAGYDVQMLFVDTSLDVALDRNAKRKERSLGGIIVKQNHKAVQGNKAGFIELFGENFAEVNTDDLKQGAALPPDVTDKIDNFTSSYINARLEAGGFATHGGDLMEQGATFDFTEFNVVKEGKQGPLFNKALERAKKYGTKDQFVLTARPMASAPHIQLFLKEQGLDIPLENITGLASSLASSKAEWIAGKIIEGYNDIYFADDHLANVKAVSDMLDQHDVKSKVVQAKIKFSKDGGTDFNEMLERVAGVDKDKVFSGAQAKLRGAKIGGFKFFVPPSAEDFKGLLYTFLGKGKQGDADMAFFKKHLLDPFSAGIRNINETKQAVSNEYKALGKKYPKVIKSLNKKVGDTDFTTDNAIRVFLWNASGFEVPGMSKRDVETLVEHVNSDNDLKAFTSLLGSVSRSSDGYIKPGEYWLTESIASDLHNITSKVNRSEFLAEWAANKDIIFSPENLNKIEAVYGTSFRNALDDILFRMEKGTNKPSGNDKIVNNFQDWINGSVGAVMFFNTRSAVLQTLSTVNFLDWQDNNLFKAAGAFANQKQYWSDFMTLFNSDMLKQRRSGMQLDVNMSELMDSVSTAKVADKSKAAIRYLLQIGFTPTQIADSFAISSGGATFYRNKIKKYLKEGMSQKDAETKAFDEFQEIAEETQQSSRPDFISQQQAGTLGRLILAWANTPMQYTRLTKKAISDLANGRGDWRSHVSRILYYGAAQNFIFSSLQTGLAFAMFGADEEEEAIKTKELRVANGMMDTLLRGTGIYGAMISTLKNTILQYKAQSEKGYGKQNWDKVVLEMISLSPPIGSKVRKIMNAIKTYEYNKGVPEKMGARIDNPMLSVVGNVVESVTNFPLDRLVRKANNIDEAITGQHELWQRVALLLGWNAWSIGTEDEDVEEAKIEVKAERKEKKAEEVKVKKAEKKKAVEDEKKAEEQKKKDEGFKNIRCSGTKSNGERCSITIETKAKTAKCTYHKTYKPNEGSDRNNNGVKEYQCKSLTGSGKRCKNRSENANKKCYAHQ